MGTAIMKIDTLYQIFWLSLASFTLLACSQPQPPAEVDKIVMVAQPNEKNQQLQSYAGEVTAAKQTALAFRVGGQVTERYADVGDRVHAGQILARLDSNDAKLLQSSAEAQLAQAQSSLKTAEADYQRLKQLLPDKAVSRSQVDMAENQYQNALASVKQAQSQLDNRTNQINYNQLVSHKSGVITQRNFEVGQVLAAGQIAYQIAISGDKDVVIGIPEQQIQSIQLNQTAQISTWSDPDQHYTGYVREISPAADQSRTFMVKVALQNNQAPIQLGQSARVLFNTHSQSQLTVPISSVSATTDKPFVFVLRPDHTVQKRWVELGEYGKDYASIHSGLNPNEWVVIGGVHLLRDKQRVQAVDADNRPIVLSAKQPHLNQQPQL